MSHPGVIGSATMREKIMSNKSGGNALYFILGAIAVAILAGGYFMIQESNEPDLAIDVSEDGIDVETN